MFNNQDVIVAGNARKEIEQKTGKKIVSTDNNKVLQRKRLKKG